jgi:hypothetical protein
MSNNETQLEKIKKIFLADNLDPEDIEDNKRTLQQWEETLGENEPLASWKEHEYTEKIVQLFKDAYKQIGLKLAYDRELTQEERQSLWNKQDAIMLMLELMLTDVDARGIVQSVKREIQTAINAT